MRSPALVLCILAVSMASLPFERALSAADKPFFLPELTQASPSVPDYWPSNPSGVPQAWPDGQAFGPNGPRLSSPREAEGPDPKPRKKPAPKTARDQAAKAEALKKAMLPRPSIGALRDKALDALFKRLAAAADPEEGQAVAAAIQQIWAHSPSDTAALLLDRGSAAMQARQYPLALELFDKVVELQPTWAEAWNKRATLRFLGDDVDGSMADIEQVLKLEPRHFGALAGMGMILQKEGLNKSALTVFRKALSINPQQPELQTLVEKLSLEVEGRGI